MTNYTKFEYIVSTNFEAIKHIYHNESIYHYMHAYLITLYAQFPVKLKTYALQFNGSIK